MAIWRPRIGQRVQLWYATKPKRKGAPTWSEVMPHHGAAGVVRIVSVGKRGPRSAGVALDSGAFVGVPLGNLREVK